MPMRNSPATPTLVDFASSYLKVVAMSSSAAKAIVAVVSTANNVNTVECMSDVDGMFLESRAAGFADNEVDRNDFLHLRDLAVDQFNEPLAGLFPMWRCSVRIELRTAVVIALMVAIATFMSAQTPAQVGNVYVGTCDNGLLNTQHNAVDVYDAAGQFVTTFH